MNRDKGLWPAAFPDLDFVLGLIISLHFGFELGLTIIKENIDNDIES